MIMHRPFRIANRLEIEKNGNCFLNPKRVELLKLILTRGSILSASKELKMSYQQAWTIIREINSASPLPIVVRQRGGTNGGGAVITKYGLEVMRCYEVISHRLIQCLDELNEELDMLCMKYEV
jgi:molybdate transport system regulatory protein